MGEPQTGGGREIAARAKARPTKAPASRKIWCAYNDTDTVLFGAELTAMRYAVDHHMSCQAVAFGIPLREQIT